MMGNIGYNWNIYKKGDFSVTIVNNDLPSLADAVKKFIDISKSVEQYKEVGSASLYHDTNASFNHNPVPVEVSMSKAQNKEKYATTVRFTQANRIGEAVLIELAEVLGMRAPNGKRPLDLDYNFDDVVRERRELEKVSQ